MPFSTHADAPGAFNGRLPGRKFPARNGGSGGERRTFQDVEEVPRGIRHGVPTARHAVTEYLRAGRDAASALRKWQLRAVDVVRWRCGADVTVQMGRTG